MSTRVQLLLFFGAGLTGMLFATAQAEFPITIGLDGGTFINSECIQGELRIRTSPQVLPYLWVPLSNRGTVLRIATAAHETSDGRFVQRGDIVGEYRVAPSRCAYLGYSSYGPSRTSVDYDGNVWVAHRSPTSFDYGHHVVKIGTGFGEQWIDRNNNGRIDTSQGYGDFLLGWCNDNQVCESSDIQYAEDELILAYVPVSATGVRLVAVDQNNDVWVGGSENHEHGLLDGQTGDIKRAFDRYACGYYTGGYGGVVDSAGVLWSAAGNDGTHLLRIDPTSNPLAHDCIAIANSYGLAVDRLGKIWNTTFDDNQVRKLDPFDPYLGSNYSTGGDRARGVAVHPFGTLPAEDDIWIANSISNTVARLARDGTLIKTINVGTEPTGVAVDSAGIVWVTNRGHEDENEPWRIPGSVNANPKISEGGQDVERQRPG